MSRLIFSAQLLAPGQGGIGQVGRLSIRALEGRLSRAFAVSDGATHTIGATSVKAFAGSRAHFVLRNNLALLSGARAFYDYAGTARANLVPRSYALWVHGAEFWTGPLRDDYVKAIRRADCVLVNSQHSANAMQNAMGEVAHQVCWLGTEYDDAPEPLPPTGPPTCLFIGRSDEFFAKGQDILVKVWPKVVSRVKDARLCMVGDGVRLGELRALAARSPAASRISVLGFQQEEAVQKLLRGATVFALLGNLEGFGLVVVEAMRHGIPVLTSTDDAACEINVDGSTGYNVPRSDEDGIVDRLVALLRDRDLASALGVGARAHWQEHFRLARFRDRFLAAAGPWINGGL